jgi:drug/metabolite transporter (DMT)-like permease
VTRRNAAEVGLALNTVLWGATFVLVKQALDDISPIFFLALRFGLATVALVVALACFGRPRLASRFNWKSAAAGALSGTFLFSGYILQTLGLKLTTAAKSAFLTGLTSAMVPLLAALVYRIRPRFSEITGVLVATAGLGLMTLPGAVGSISPGDLLTAFCAAGFAAHIVTLGHFSERMSFEVLSIMQVGAAGLWALALLGWAEVPRVVWRPSVLSGVLIAGLLCTALAFTIQAWAMQYTTSTRAALIYLFEPVVAWMTSYIFLGEGLSRRAAAGAALILLGILLVELKPWDRRKHPSK